MFFYGLVYVYLYYSRNLCINLRRSLYCPLIWSCVGCGYVCEGMCVGMCVVMCVGMCVGRPMCVGGCASFTYLGQLLQCTYIRVNALSI